MPKPSRLIERILQVATSPGDLVLDSFAGSGTTGHAVLKLNQTELRREPRRFILVEMEPKIARDITAERVRRVAQGYKNAKSEKVEGIGGSFRYCELGEPLFDESGKIREIVSFSDLARHVYFTETGEPLPRGRVTKSPFLGECRGLGIYLLYNGILGDKSTRGGNILTRAVLVQLPKYDGQKDLLCRVPAGKRPAASRTHFDSADAVRDQSELSMAVQKKSLLPGSLEPLILVVRNQRVILDATWPGSME